MLKFNAREMKALCLSLIELYDHLPIIDFRNHSESHLLPFIVSNNSFAYLHINFCIFNCKNVIFSTFRNPNPWLCLQFDIAYFDSAFDDQNFADLILFNITEERVFGNFIEKNWFVEWLIKNELMDSLR